VDTTLVDVGTVSGEGGPLLLADRETVTAWRGSDEEYERLCTLFDERPGAEGFVIAIDRGFGLVWEMEGGGTAYVFRRGRDYAVVARTWLEDPDDPGAPRALAEAAATELLRIGELVIRSGVLAILWAPESGHAFESIDAAGLPMGEMSMGGTGLTLEIAPGIYDCFHDRVTNSAGDARRCLIRRASSEE
jgi:hypothetical protein